MTQANFSCEVCGISAAYEDVEPATAELMGMNFNDQHRHSPEDLQRLYEARRQASRESLNFFKENGDI